MAAGGGVDPPLFQTGEVGSDPSGVTNEGAAAATGTAAAMAEDPSADTSQAEACGGNFARRRSLFAFDYDLYQRLDASVFLVIKARSHFVLYLSGLLALVGYMSSLDPSSRLVTGRFRVKTRSWVACVLRFARNVWG